MLDNLALLCYDIAKLRGAIAENEMGGEVMADKLEKVVEELKHLDDDELNKVWGFALGLMAKRDTVPAA